MKKPKHEHQADDHAKVNATDFTSFPQSYRISVESGDLFWLEGHWYVTHSGLIRLARRKHCAGISVEPVAEFSDPETSQWAFKATVYKSRDVPRLCRLRRC